MAIPPTYYQVPELKFLKHQLSGSKPLPETKLSGSISLDLSGVGIPMEPGMYALFVYDESMIDAGIQHGDIALLKLASPQRGDIVAVEMDGRILLRRYLIIAQIPHLLAENPFRPDLRFAGNLPMQGVLWGSIRTEAVHLRPDHVRRTSVSYSKRQEAGPSAGSSTCLGAKRIPGSVHRRGEKSGQSKTVQKTRGGIKSRPTPPKPSHDVQCVWPKVPSGIELNDMSNLEYKTGAEVPAEEMRNYGHALEQAIKDYEQNEQKRSKAI